MVLHGLNINFIIFAAILPGTGFFIVRYDFVDKDSDYGGNSHD
jgi:hypothetical protein